MIAYELMINTNRHIMEGGTLTEEQKANIVNQLLFAVNIPKQPSRHFGMEPNSKARRPLFFFPPHNDGKKLKTLFGQIPKTHILNENMYELEILRLLCLLAPENPDIADMVAQTLNRLKATCFGYHGCYLGECFDSALIVLRFLTIAAPNETAWMKTIIDVYNYHAADKKRVKCVERYYKLCLSELPFKDL